MFQQRLVVAAVDKFLRYPPQLGKPAIGLDHVAGVVHRKYAVGRRTEYALQLHFAGAQCFFRAFAFADVAGKHNEAGLRAGFDRFARNRQLEPHHAVRQLKFELPPV